MGDMKGDGRSSVASQEQTKGNSKDDESEACNHWAWFVRPKPRERGVHPVRPFPPPHLHLTCTKPAKLSHFGLDRLRLNHFGSRLVHLSRSCGLAPVKADEVYTQVPRP